MPQSRTPGFDEYGRARSARALDLYRNGLVPACLESWCEQERRRRSERSFRRARELLRCVPAPEDAGRAIDCARRLVAARLVDEEAHRLLMRLYAEPGPPAGRSPAVPGTGASPRGGPGIAPSESTQALARAIETDNSGGHLLPIRGPPRRLRNLDPPGDAVPLGSPFYVERETDHELRGLSRAATASCS